MDCSLLNPAEYLRSWSGRFVIGGYGQIGFEPAPPGANLDALQNQITVNRIISNETH